MRRTTAPSGSRQHRAKHPPMSLAAVIAVWLSLAGLPCCGGKTSVAQWNCGVADTVTTTDGLSWTGRTDFRQTVTQEPISSADPFGRSVLFQSECYTQRPGQRTLEDLTVPIAESNRGLLEVTLMFAEIFHTLPNNRVFNLFLQRKMVVHGLDVFERVGKNKALELRFAVPVCGDSLIVGLQRETGDPQISAVQVSRLEDKELPKLVLRGNFSLTSAQNLEAQQLIEDGLGVKVHEMALVAPCTNVYAVVSPCDEPTVLSQLPFCFSLRDTADTYCLFHPNLDPPAAEETLHVVNPSFEETLAVLPEGESIQGMSGWYVENPSVGTFRPKDIEIPGGATDGQLVAFVGSQFGLLRQQLDATVQANTVYTLSVDVGERSDKAGIRQYRIALLAGPLWDLQTLASLDEPVNPQDGWLRATVQNQTSASPPHLGQPLFILLQAIGDGDQVLFDNVTLTAAPVAGAAAAVPCQSLPQQAPGILGSCDTSGATAWVELTLDGEFTSAGSLQTSLAPGVAHMVELAQQQPRDKLCVGVEFSSGSILANVTIHASTQFIADQAAADVLSAVRSGAGVVVDESTQQLFWPQVTGSSSSSFVVGTTATTTATTTTSTTTTSTSSATTSTSTPTTSTTTRTTRTTATTTTATTTTSTSGETEAPESSTSSGGLFSSLPVLIGIAAGGAVVLLLVCCCCIRCRRRRKAASRHTATTMSPDSKQRHSKAPTGASKDIMVAYETPTPLDFPEPGSMNAHRRSTVLYDLPEAPDYAEVEASESKRDRRRQGLGVDNGWGQPKSVSVDAANPTVLNLYDELSFDGNNEASTDDSFNHPPHNQYAYPQDQKPQSLYALPQDNQNRGGGERGGPGAGSNGEDDDSGFSWQRRPTLRVHQPGSGSPSGTVRRPTLRLSPPQQQQQQQLYADPQDNVGGGDGSSSNYALPQDDRQQKTINLQPQPMYAEVQERRGGGGGGGNRGRAGEAAEAHELSTIYAKPGSLSGMKVAPMGTVGVMDDGDESSRGREDSLDQLKAHLYARPVKRRDPATGTMTTEVLYEETGVGNKQPPPAAMYELIDEHEEPGEPVLQPVFDKSGVMLQERRPPAPRSTSSSNRSSKVLDMDEPLYEELKDPALHRLSVGLQHTMQPWFHGQIGAEKAKRLLFAFGKAEGRFLVREVQVDRFEMVLQHDGRACVLPIYFKDGLFQYKDHQCATLQQLIEQGHSDLVFPTVLKSIVTREDLVIDDTSV